MEDPYFLEHILVYDFLHYLRRNKHQSCYSLPVFTSSSETAGSFLSFSSCNLFHVLVELCFYLYVLFLSIVASLYFVSSHSQGNDFPESCFWSWFFLFGSTTTLARTVGLAHQTQMLQRMYYVRVFWPMITVLEGYNNAVCRKLACLKVGTFFPGYNLSHNSWYSPSKTKTNSNAGDWRG